MKTVAILEGWAGGPKLTTKLRKELAVKGFAVSNNLINADIVVAHSTGCYMLPRDIKAKLLIFIDPPYWPGRSIVGRWIDLLKSDTSLLFNGLTLFDFLVKKFWETFYIFAKPSFTWSVIKNQSQLGFLDKHKGMRLVLVRNKDDQFCSPQIKARLSAYNNVRYKELPGDHEDYYSNPAPYIDLILKEL
jgi:hypothetical protein